MWKYTLFSLTLMLAACSRGPDAISSVQPQAVAQPLFGSLYSNVRQPARIVIRDQETWARLWAQIVGAQSNPPAVDFDKDNVIVAAMGERQRAGYAISIDGVTQESATVRVDVSSTVPAPACAGADVITTPLSAVLIPKTSDSIQFSERTVVLSCD